MSSIRAVIRMVLFRAGLYRSMGQRLRLARGRVGKNTVIPRQTVTFSLEFPR